ncbi:MAG: tetratricopeptide repeat protein [Candidatus Omnitrophica bacterium]|nr:tetratricopeptide repeat protein [Candidatus Omnitrophota bacterium]
MIKKSILLIFTTGFVFFAQAEVVVFKNGKVIEGEITERTSQYLKIELSGISIKYYLETIESIDGEKISDLGLSKEGVELGAKVKQDRVISETWRKHYAQAEQYLENRQYEQAILEFNEVLKEDPGAYEAYTGIGFANIQLGKYEEAIANFKKAIEINSEYVQAYDNIGVVYSFLRRYREALPYFDKAISIDPEFVTAYNNLASTYLFLGQYQEAVIYYQKAFQIDPQNADSARSLGVAYNDLGKAKEAKEYLEKAIELYKAQGDYHGVQKAEDQLKNIPKDSLK